MPAAWADNAARIAAGQPAFEAMYRALRQEAHAFARRLLHDHDEVAETVRLAFLVLFDDWPKRRHFSDRENWQYVKILIRRLARATQRKRKGVTPDGAPNGEPANEEGEPADLGHTFCTLVPEARAYARNVLRDYDVEDVVSDAFHELSKGWKTRQHCTTEANWEWLRVVIWRLANKERKRRNRFVDPEGVLAEPRDLRSDDAISSADLRSYLDQLLGDATPTERNDVVLVHALDMDYRAVGAERGASPGSVKTSAWRGRRKAVRAAERLDGSRDRVERSTRRA
jgi:DNA-directed RNA polymerase specialized sigma24 family protein